MASHQVGEMVSHQVEGMASHQVGGMASRRVGRMASHQVGGCTARGWVVVGQGVWRHGDIGMGVIPQAGAGGWELWGTPR